MTASHGDIVGPTPKQLAFVDTAVGRFAYIASGPESGPVVLCWHGFPDHPPSFWPMMEELAERGYRCIAPYSRGYWPSLREGPFTVEQLAQDMCAVARAFGGRDVILVGHDWGAVIAYAALGNAPAGLFRCAVTLAVPHPLAFLKSLRHSRRQRRQSGYMLLFQLPGISDAVVARNNFAFVDRLWQSWSPGLRLPAAQRRALHTCLANSMPAPLAYYRAMVRPVAAAVNRVKEIAPIHTPVLNLMGADDGCIRPEAGADQQRWFDGLFRMDVVNGAGHFLQLEQPATVALRVHEWASEHEAQGAVVAS